MRFEPFEALSRWDDWKEEEEEWVVSWSGCGDIRKLLRQEYYANPLLLLEEAEELRLANLRRAKGKGVEGEEAPIPGVAENPVQQTEDIYAGLEHLSEEQQLEEALQRSLQAPTLMKWVVIGERSAQIQERSDDSSDDDVRLSRLLGQSSTAGGTSSVPAPEELPELTALSAETSLPEINTNIQEWSDVSGFFDKKISEEEREVVEKVLGGEEMELIDEEEMEDIADDTPMEEEQVEIQQVPLKWPLLKK